MVDNKKIGQRIKMLRKDADLTQMDLARQLGYNSTGMISQVEAGSRGMDLDKLARCAEILGVTLDDLYKSEFHDASEIIYVKRLREAFRTKSIHLETIKLALDSSDKT